MSLILWSELQVNARKTLLLRNVYQKYRCVDAKCFFFSVCRTTVNLNIVPSPEALGKGGRCGAPEWVEKTSLLIIGYLRKTLQNFRLVSIVAKYQFYFFSINIILNIRTNLKVTFKLSSKGLTTCLSCLVFLDCESWNLWSKS